MGGWGQGGVIHMMPAKPFETVPVIEGYKNNIAFNLIELLATASLVNLVCCKPGPIGALPVWSTMCAASLVH